MKPLMNSVLFLAWVSVYLLAIAWISRYRKARVHDVGLVCRDEYRAEKDALLWLAVFILGVFLLALAYGATRAFGLF